MTEYTDKEQKSRPHSDELQEKSVEKELELTKTIAEEALKKVEMLSRENAELRERLKQIEKIYRKY